MSCTRDKVSEVVQDLLGVEDFEVKDEAVLTEDLGMDSLDMVELVMFLEEDFEIEIEDEFIFHRAPVSFGELVRYVESRRK